MNSKRKLLRGALLVVGLLTVCISGMFYLNGNQVIEPTASEKAQLQMLDKYGGMTYEDIQAIPKQDRPDLAQLQNIEMTRDPNLGYVPEGAGMQAYRRLQKNMASFQAKAIEGVTWQERGPNNIGGRTRALMWDPNTANKVWAGGVSGGLWYNTDVTNDSTVWQAVDNFWENIAVSCIAYDPNSTQTFYVGTGEGWFNSDAVQGAGIWKTVDGGNTWNQLSSTDNSNFYRVQKVAVLNEGVVLAATRTGLYRSADGGATWSTMMSGSFADIEVAGNGDVYVSQGIFSTGTLYRSTDNGLNYTDVTPTTGGERIEIGLAPGNDSVVYAVASSNTAIAWMYRSDNMGSTWTSLTVPRYLEQSCVDGTDDFARGQAWYDLILAVDPNNDMEVVVGGISHHKSNDGGVTWTPISYWTGGCEQYVHADQHAIATNPNNPNAAVMGSDGGVSYTADLWSADKPTFNDRNNGYNVTQFYSADVRPDSADAYVLTGAQDNGSLQMFNAGIGGAVEATGGDGAFSHVDQDSNAYHYTAYIYTSYYQSVDNGNSFNTLIFNTSFGRFINPTDYDDETKRMYGAGNNDQFVYSNQLNQTNGWFLASPDLNGGQVSAVTVSPYTMDRIFLGTGSGDLFLIDSAPSSNGPTVTEIGSPSFPAGYISCVAIGTSDDELLVTFSNYGVTSIWETDNGGATWTSREGDLPDMPVRWALYNPNNTEEVLIATELGVWSTDSLSESTTSWGATNTGLANVRTDMLQYRASDGQVTVATHGRGVFTGFPFSNDGGVTPTPEEPTGSLVAYYALDTCFGTIAYDSLGVNNGTIAGASAGPGYLGQGLTFDGVNDQIDLGSDSSLSLTGDFTFSMWVNTTENNPYRTLLMNNQEGNAFGYSMSIHEGRPALFLGGLSNAGPYIASDSVTDGTWHHVVATRSSDTVQFYIDGVLNRIFAGVSGTINPNYGSSVTIGMRTDITNNFQYEGQLDEIRIYNYAISTSEIQALAGASQAAVACSDFDNQLVGAWDMNNCNYGFLTNSVVDYDGVLHNGVRYDSGYNQMGLVFDGVNGYVDLNDTAWSLGSGDAFTYSFWLNPSDVSSPFQTLVYRNTGGGAGPIAQLHYNRISVFLGGLSNPGPYVSPTTLNEGTWYQVTVTYGNGTLNIYIDGTLSHTVANLSGSLNFGDGDHWLGMRPDFSNQYQFTGSMDEARFFNAAISAEAAALEASRTSFVPVDCTPSPVGNWLFDSCSSVVALDQEGLNNGTFEGATRSAGYSGAGVSFDGTNDYINLGTGSELELTDEFTIAMWLNPSNSRSYATVMTKNREGNSYGYYVQVHNGVPAMFLGGSIRKFFSSQQSIPLNTWTHVAFVLKNGTVTSYINGSASASLAAPGVLPANSSAETWLGMRADFSDRFQYAGSMDELFVSNIGMENFDISTLSGVAQNSSDCGGPVNVPVLPGATANLGGDLDEVAVGMLVYPNPSAGDFTLELNDIAADESVQIMVTNAVGQVVYEHYGPISSARHEVRLNTPAPGLYVLQVSSADLRWTERLYVE